MHFMASDLRQDNIWKVLRRFGIDDPIVYDGLGLQES